MGNPGDIVRVKNGYARNYLLPKQLAVVKSDYSLKILDKQKAEFEKIIAERNELYKNILKKLDEIGEIRVEVKAGDDDKLFGTITPVILADLINKEIQIQIDRKQITIKKQVKLLGSYTAQVQLSKDFKTEIKFKVIRSS